MGVFLLLSMDHTFLPIGYPNLYSLIIIHAFICSALLWHVQHCYRCGEFNREQNDILVFRKLILLWGKGTRNDAAWLHSVKVWSCHLTSWFSPLFHETLCHMMLIWVTFMWLLTKRDRLLKSDIGCGGDFSTSYFPYIIFFPESVSIKVTSLFTWPHKALRSSKLKTTKPS